MKSTPSEQWHVVASRRSINESQRVLKTIDGRRVAVFEVDGALVAIDNHCPHQAGPVAAGECQSGVLTCPWHGASFDLRTGRCLDGGAGPLRKHSVREHQGNVEIQFQQIASPADETHTDGVSRFLVRYGTLAHVDHFGTIHDISCQRGTKVIVATDQGLEVGEVLSQQQPSATSDLRLRGEVLRVASPEDLEVVAQRRVTSSQLLIQAQAAVGALSVSLALVDAETLWDGRTAIVYFLGDSTAELGPVAVKLGQENQCTVRFQSMSIQPELSNAGVANGESCDTSDQSVEQIWGDVSPRERVKFDKLTDLGVLSKQLEDSSRRLGKESATLLEFHGIYQQRIHRALKVSVVESQDESRTLFMIRVALAGGRLTTVQLERMLELAGRYASSGLRLTSRQGLQLHGVEKVNLKTVVQSIDRSLLSTMAACGDTVRSIMACPAPLALDGTRRRLQRFVGELSRDLQPSLAAYRKLWFDSDSEQVSSSDWDASDGDAFYGRSFLPHKFKIAVAPARDNCVDLLAHDIGLRAVVEQDQLTGFDFFIGGGLGRTMRDPTTYPRLGSPLGFVAFENAALVVRKLIEIYRDHGSRNQRRSARFKYLVDEIGESQIAQMVRQACGSEDVVMAPSIGQGQLEQASFGTLDDHLGWHRQDDKRLFLGLHVPLGRISNHPHPLAEFLAAFLSRFRGGVRVTPQQNLLLCDIDRDRQTEVQRLLQAYGVTPIEEVPYLVRNAMACPAQPTCRFAMSPAETITDELLAELRQAMDAAQLDTSVQLKVIGCDNGCARGYTSEVAIVGRGRDEYALFLGGAAQGTRLNFLFRSGLNRDQVLELLLSLLQEHAKNGGEADESFGDYCHRVLRPPTSPATNIAP